jgi:hypothetical protein
LFKEKIIVFTLDSNNGSLHSRDESEDDADDTQESLDSISALQQLYSVFLLPNLRPAIGQERTGKAVRS